MPTKHMKRLCAFLVFLALALSGLSAFAYEDTPVSFLVNGKSVSFPFTPLVRDGVTYADLSALCGTLSLSCKKYSEHDSYVVGNARTSVCFVPNEPYATVSDLTGKSDKEYTYFTLTAPCIYINNHLAVAVRDVASIFSYALSFNKDTLTVYFGYSPQMISSSARSAVNQKAYYFQNQAEFSLPSFGSGYCWACSYAMLITNLTGQRVTPSDIAAINLTKGASGAYCYHNEIVSAYNLKFTSAISESSSYYGGRSDRGGATLVKNPYKDDRIATEALKEALTLHPEGVIVRYDDFPHSMLAVAYDGDMILFNDPAPSSSSAYSDTGRYQGVPFSETCVAKKGFVLSDMTFIQAISVK